MINAEDIAKDLYETYCREVGGKAFNGDPLPNWQEFSSDPNKRIQCAAWVAAAERAIQILTA